MGRGKCGANESGGDWHAAREAVQLSGYLYEINMAAGGAVPRRGTIE